MIVPVIRRGVEDEDIVEILTLVILSSKNYEVAVESVH